MLSNKEYQKPRMHKKVRIYYLLIFLILTAGCQSINNDVPETLFTLIDPDRSNVDFVNRLDYLEEFNIYRYRNFYNGGGVALGDINQDGLMDIYFASNMHGNRLYLNNDNFEFEDITEMAGVKGTRSWSTGVSIADVNGDGWLDIYVCNSGDFKGDNKQNELFLNNGDLTFSEQAEKYGIADIGLSIHAAFFDYDKDGDLDLYLLNNSSKAIGSFSLSDNQRMNRNPDGGDKLFRNDGQVFSDVSIEAGIYGSIIGFGLGVTVGDIDLDGWMDIYVSNDFFERDYIYMNNQDGTFTERLTEMMRSISAASMGADMADINNDGYPEIFVTDMIPEHDDRLKTKTTFDSWDSYNEAVENDYYHQFTRNMLNLNNTDGTFSEIGRLMNVYATDWSWGALIFDMNNDGYKDLFVANGIYQDLTDQDYIKYFSNPRIMRMIITDNNVDYPKLIEAIPSVKISNYAFSNEGDLTFKNKAEAWGLAQPSHSNGSAYGDLDNDGDLDLVVNNVNMPAFVYRNNTSQYYPENHYLKFILRGEGKNRYAIGTKIIVKDKGEERHIEQMPTRGFQSTVGHDPVIGLGRIEFRDSSDLFLDSIIVKWPDEKITLLTNVKVDQILTLYQKDGTTKGSNKESKNGATAYLFEDVSKNKIIDFTHQENAFIDFSRDRLIYHMLSTQGPRISHGDINNDGLSDLFICGARGLPGALFLQVNNGSFIKVSESVFEKDKTSEDTDAVFFDADNDGDQDLYVASGGTEFSTSSKALKDRLYLNDGFGRFTNSEQVLPAGRYESTSCVRAADYDQDGIIELFVGIRQQPFLYGVPVNGYILENDGHGNLTVASDKHQIGLTELGMITDMQWVDIDNDKDLDMVIVGEWMPITIFINDSGQFKNITPSSGLAKTNGWWNRIKTGDFDKDGDLDLVAGNHGWNTRFKASLDKPVTMYVNDFDMNGSVEQIICVYNGERSYPLALKHDLLKQIPSLEIKYPNYVDYKEQTITDIFTADQLQKALELKAYQMASSVILNNGDGTFQLRPLPVEVQLSPVYGIHIEDVDEDGKLDILLGGNLYGVKPEVGRYDASYGNFLKGKGDGTFSVIAPKYSGFRLYDEVRDITRINTVESKLLIVAKNNQPLQIFKY